MISVSTRERWVPDEGGGTGGPVSGVPGRSRTSDARFVAAHDVHFTTGTIESRRRESNPHLLRTGEALCH
jgi:hypothetical protein